MTEFDGAPCAVKVARTVWGGGKSGDYFKGLPIAIGRKIPGHETVDGWRRRCPGRHPAHSFVGNLVQLREWADGTEHP